MGHQGWGTRAEPGSAHAGRGGRCTPEAVISPMSPARWDKCNFLPLCSDWSYPSLPVSLEPPWASTPPSVKWGSWPPLLGPDYQCRGRLDCVL